MRNIRKDSLKGYRGSTEELADQSLKSIRVKGLKGAISGLGLGFKGFGAVGPEAPWRVRTIP